LQHKCEHVENLSKDRKTINISKTAVVLRKQWFRPTALKPFITDTWSLGLGGAASGVDSPGSKMNILD
jgi:hypothetical protein